VTDTLAPLRLARFPTVGPTGDRDNLERLYALQAALVPPGRVLLMDVVHDQDCPAYDGAKPGSACTCDAVDVTLRLHDPRTS